MKSELKTLTLVAKEAGRALDNASASSARLSRHNTSTLIGVMGGFLGLAAAYGASLVLPVSLPIAAFIATGLGITGGVLSFRLSRGADAEYRLDRNRVACEEILDRIRQLPPGTPKVVRDELWNTYMYLNSIGAMAHTLPQRRIDNSAPATKQFSNGP